MQAKKTPLRQLPFENEAKPDTVAEHSGHTYKGIDLASTLEPMLPVNCRLCYAQTKRQIQIFI